MPAFAFDPRDPVFARRQERLAAAFRREPGHDVPVFGPDYGRVPRYSIEETLADFDKKLEEAVAKADAAALPDSDWPPYIDTFVSICLVPEIFGCPIRFTEDGGASALPRVEEIDQVWSLTPMHVDEAPMTKALFGWTDYAQRKLGTDVPIWTIDIQSPFSAALEICDSIELLSACIEDPKAVHHLLRMVTDVSLELMEKHLARMERPGYPGRNYPSIAEDIGICIADDTPLAMLGPAQYREFARPYNEEIGRAFNGLHVHSCGDYTRTMDALLETETLRSLQVRVGPGEFPLPLSPEEDHPFNRARRQVAYCVDNTPVGRADIYNDPQTGQRDCYEDYLLPRLAAGDLTGCILQSCAGPGMRSVEDASRWTAWTRERLDAHRAATA